MDAWSVAGGSDGRPRTGLYGDLYPVRQRHVNFDHLHLLLNHVPIIGFFVGVGLFVASFTGNNEDLRRSALIIFAAVALLTIPTFVSGVGADRSIAREPGVSEALVRRHEGAAMLGLWFVEAT